MLSNITLLENQIRDRINAPRMLHGLLQRKEDWHRLCSALDVIGDTELALNAYLAHPAVGDDGTRYLHVYGALQILQTQQDAVDSVCTALQLKTKTPPAIPLIRGIRSSAVAHPTFQRENKRSKSSFIGRHTLSQYGFSLETMTGDQWPSLRTSVNIPELIDLQRKFLSETLGEVIAILDKAEMQHRQKFRSERLTTCFPDQLDYFFEKISEGIHKPGHSDIGAMGLSFVSDCLAKMQAMLEKRGDWGAYEAVNYEYQLLQHALNRLSAYFSDRGESTLDRDDAYVFFWFLRERIKSVIQIAREIDAAYESSPSKGVRRAPTHRKR